MYESVTIVAGDIVQKAPKLLNNDTLSWNDWFEMITGIVIAGGSYDLALLTSELSVKHDLSNFNTLWNKVVTYNKHHFLLRKILLKYSFVLKLRFKLDEIRNDEKVRSFVDDIKEHPYIAARASYGMGKTYFGMKPLIHQCKQLSKTVLFITEKVSLSYHLTTTLGLKIYQGNDDT